MGKEVRVEEIENAKFVVRLVSPEAHGEVPTPYTIILFFFLFLFLVEPTTYRKIYIL